jgi:hypothetical protein
MEEGQHPLRGSALRLGGSGICTVEEEGQHPLSLPPLHRELDSNLVWCGTEAEGAVAGEIELNNLLQQQPSSSTSPSSSAFSLSPPHWLSSQSPSLLGA